MFIYLLSFFIFTSLAETPVLSHSFFGNYNDCKIEKEMVYLDKKKKVKLSKVVISRDIPSIITSYNVDCNKKNLTVYLLSDLVRTHYQKAFVSIKEGQLKNLEVVSFTEPEKYKAPLKFIKSFLGKKDLKDIDGLTGATLTRSSLIRMSKLALELDKIK